MLDFSSDPLPPVPRPLKRSASVASLPTPPRTHHKRKHATRSVAGDDSDTDLDDTASETESEKPHNKNKKQRTSSTKSADAEEDAFWLSKSDGDAPATAAAPIKHLPRGLVYRRLAPATSTSSVGSAPVSPPPSNRKPVAVSPPATPEPQRPKRNIPVRDSPNNPFLVSPASIVEDSTSPTPSLSPHTPKYQEQPTVTYVFRGVRGTFPNPLYDHERKRPRSPSARSRLPFEHPDYSPDAHCVPKVLFPMAPRKSRARLPAKTLEEELKNGKRKRSVSVSGSGSEDDDEDEGDMIMPKKLDFTAFQAGSSQKQQ
ncbi:hypothetical protein C0993_005592 [Termitomyces sp. T159_Od127]|nr:hypothetical protein C0993_005592 [Termitomyces sp. T159_Od127]